MSSLIGDNLRDALILQWGHEIYNSHLYAYIMAFLKNKGLDNLASLFAKQHDEEQEHASIILSLLTDLNAYFDAPPIDGCRMGFESIGSVAKAYLDREILTTKSLNEIKNLAIDDENPVVEERIREMILLQQAEYAEATGFMDNAELLSEWWQVALWDKSLGE